MDQHQSPTGPSTGTDPGKAPLTPEQKRAVTVGLIFIGLGLLGSIGTYVLAESSPTGGKYLIMFGPVIYGVIKLAKAFPDKPAQT